MKIKVKYYKPIINWCDYQSRIMKNNNKIKWENKVHEVLIGFKHYSYLPSEEEYCLYHHKEIKRQEIQNNYYEEI